jgi:hypothetical protein
MTEAPEKIWAYAGSFKMWRDHKTDQPHEQTQYTRSDIADELQAEVARLSNILLTISILEVEYRQFGRIARAALEYGEVK